MEHLPAVAPMYYPHNKSQCSWSCLGDSCNLTKSLNFPENVLYISFFLGFKRHENSLFFNIFTLLFQSGQNQEEQTQYKAQHKQAAGMAGYRNLHMIRILQELHEIFILFRRNFEDDYQSRLIII